MNQFGKSLFGAPLLAATLIGSSSATDLVGLRSDSPQVRFDVPLSVLAAETSEMPPGLAPGERLLLVELPVSVVVSRGDVDRVGEVVIEVDGAEAGLRVEHFSPATQLETEYAGDIQVQSTSESDRHLEGSLGGFLPNPGGAVAQLAPSIAAGVAGREAETETASRLAPKEAIVVAGATNRRQGVLFKFRPSSQTTLEGERKLTIAFIAPADFEAGELSVRCWATGERRMLFVKQRKVWGSTTEPVTLRLAQRVEADETPATRRVAKPVIED